MNKRLRQAVVEAEAIPDYDYLLINDHIEPCAFSLNRIIRGTEDADHDAVKMQVPAEGGEKTQLTFEGKSVSNARWAGVLGVS